MDKELIEIDKELREVELEMETYLSKTESIFANDIVLDAITQFRQRAIVFLDVSEKWQYIVSRLLEKIDTLEPNKISVELAKSTNRIEKIRNELFEINSNIRKVYYELHNIYHK